MLAVCGLLCMSKESVSAHREAFVGAITIYFGFFGIMRLGAYIDVVLVMVAAYLLARNAVRVPQLTQRGAQA
jgi:hypothetical protein